MRALYTATLLLVLFLPSGCSKDFLKSYDERIIDTWMVMDVDRFGFTGSDNLPFSENGVFTFAADGQATYTYDGSLYKGSWDIRRENDEEGNQKKALQITVIDFTSQELLSDLFNEMHFTSTDRFNAFIYYGSRTYVYRFERQ